LDTPRTLDGFGRDASHRGVPNGCSAF
jgi:hypothetical protein